MIQSSKTDLSLCFFVLLIVLCAGSCVVSCGAPHKSIDIGPRGTLRFKSENNNSILEINETIVGPIGLFEKQGVLLKPGMHRIFVRAEGFFEQYLLIEVIENQVQVIEIKLRAKPN